MSQKVEKVHKDDLDFFEFGKILKFDPPPDLIWEKFEIGKILNFGNPLKKRNISLKHLKLPKNYFKTNLFFVHYYLDFLLFQNYCDKSITKIIIHNNVFLLANAD